MAEENQQLGGLPPILPSLDGTYASIAPPIQMGMEFELPMDNIQPEPEREISERHFGLELNTADIIAIANIVTTPVAQNIIDGRPFNSLDEVQKVIGVGRLRYRALVEAGCYVKPYAIAYADNTKDEERHIGEKRARKTNRMTDFVGDEDSDYDEGQGVIDARKKRGKPWSEADLVNLHQKLLEHEDLVNHWKLKKAEATRELARAFTKEATARRKLSQALEATMTPEQRMLEKLESCVTAQSRLSHPEPINEEVLNEFLKHSPEILNQGANIIMENSKVFNLDSYLVFFTEKWKKEENDDAKVPLIKICYRILNHFLKLQSETTFIEVPITLVTATAMIDTACQYSEDEACKVIDQLIKKCKDAVGVLYPCFAHTTKEYPEETEILQYFALSIMNLLNEELSTPIPEAESLSQSRDASSVKCLCNDCQKLKAFLEHPQQIEISFECTKSERHHLLRKLDWGLCGGDITHRNVTVGKRKQICIEKTGESSPHTIEKRKQRRFEEKRILATLLAFCNNQTSASEKVADKEKEGVRDDDQSDGDVSVG